MVLNSVCHPLSSISLSLVFVLTRTIGPKRLGNFFVVRGRAEVVSGFGSSISISISGESL